MANQGNPFPEATHRHRAEAPTVPLRVNPAQRPKPREACTFYTALHYVGHWAAGFHGLPDQQHCIRVHFPHLWAWRGRGALCKGNPVISMEARPTRSNLWPHLSHSQQPLLVLERGFKSG